ncbi:peptidoglycan-binding protein LysM [Chitinasiproducens palmae]|uniref:BON domain-containing protein n=1 Tax=Chitinasiproducens palmae TaxID=1770053 RepID=A0A1H2PPG2_9BURK|nr:peptidoglycan-binding protein LysM [Chitinasiproducens palmae]SDV47777.1 BON domain-containing protein [Chitinasiproducens palmae]
MGILNFIKDAGEKLFGGNHAQAAPAPSAAAPAAAPDVAALNKVAGDAIANYVRTQGLNADNLDIKYDGASHTATVSGQAPDQATREKIIIAAGNVQHVEKVNDQLTVAGAPAAPAGGQETRYHTVVAGDTLWKIAEKYYGSGAKNNVIFEANRPMLSSPDKIYPGQVLRIPAA